MSEELVSHQLSDQQRTAATLDAVGHDRKQIAEMVGVSVSSIGHWRGIPEYKAEVERLRAIANQDLEPLRQRAEALHAQLKVDALEAAGEALKATMARGHPDWAARLRAAELILTKSGVREAGSKEAAVAAAQAVVKFVFDENGKRPRVVEGEAHEIT